MTNRTTDHAPSLSRVRGLAFRRMVLATAVAGVVAVAGLGGYVYYRNNSASHLASRAWLALEQGDASRALDYLNRALVRHPADETSVGLRDMKARALMDSNPSRDTEARAELQQALAIKPGNAESLDLLAKTYTNPAFRKLRDAFKPISADAAEGLRGTIRENIAGLGKLPPSAGNLVAEAQLHRLDYLIQSDQYHQATAEFDAANIAQDDASAARAQGQAATVKAAAAKERDLARTKLQEALKLDPKHGEAATLLAQYDYQDQRYDRVLALHDQMKAANLLSADLVLTAARSAMGGAPDDRARLADAQKMLEAYLADHPADVRTMVALGDVLLDQGKVAEAAKLGEQATAKAPHDLYAKILLINCRLRDNKPDDAQRLIVPLTTTYSNKPEVWYLKGMADAEAGDAASAANAFRKALAVNPGYTIARQALLRHEQRSGNLESAAGIAAQVLRDDRYDMAAWEVTADGLRARGQADRARQLLVTLARDPDLPADARPNLVRLLVKYGAAADAKQLLATLPADDRTTLTLRALVAAAAGNTAAARGQLAKAVEANPDDVDLRLQYVGLLAESNLPAEARAQLDRVMAAAKGVSAAQAVAAADGYLGIRLPNQALAAVKPVLDKQPQHVEALSLAERARMMIDGAAAGGIAAAVDLQKASADDLARLADAALRQKNYPEALRVANAGLSREKSNVPLHLRAARALMGMGEMDQAVDHAVAAAAAAPDAAGPFAAFVDLFPSADLAFRGIGYGSRLEAVNPALGAWAMGRLAEASGQADAALRYYTAGMAALKGRLDPRAAKDELYQSLLGLYAKRNDAAAIRKTADALAAADTSFSPGIRLLAATHLTALGDRDGAAAQLDAVAGRLTPASPPRLTLTTAGGYLAIGQGDKARGLMEKQVAAAPDEPALLDAYATLLAQAKDFDKAVAVRAQLCTLDPNTLQYRLALAEAQALAGDVPAAFRTLDAVAAGGGGGKQIAGVARLRLLINLGLLDQAGQELQARAQGGSAADDYSSALAVGQAWAQLKKPEEARKLIAGIPAYAGEYGPAQLLSAGLDMEAGKAAAAVETLQKLLKQAPGAAGQIAPQLVLAYIRSGNTGAALDLALQRRGGDADGGPAWNNWTTLAATAAREGRQYDRAAALLAELPADARKAAGLDLALLQVLQGKPVDPAVLAALPDDAPTYNRTTLTLVGGGKADAAAVSRVLADGLPSAVLAAVAALPADGRAAAAARAGNNPHVIPGDLDAALREVGASADAGGRLRQLALANRLMEAGWSTTALDVAAALEKEAPDLTAAAVLKHQALTDLRRAAEADAVRDALAQRAKTAPDRLTPSARVLLAAAWAKQEKYDDAIAVMEPLAALKRPNLLTTLASLYEKAGQLDKAVALHRQVRAIAPGDLAAANNLAYTLAASHPTDKAALEEARKAIEFAIQQAPQVTAFQDTLGWIEILSGQAAEGTKRIARVNAALRLDPAVHYHLGMGYARSGQNDLARIHLRNVEKLATDHKAVPELPLAVAALRELASTQ